MRPVRIFSGLVTMWSVLHDLIVCCVCVCMSMCGTSKPICEMRSALARFVFGHPFTGEHERDVCLCDIVDCVLVMFGRIGLCGTVLSRDDVDVRNKQSFFQYLFLLTAHCFQSISSPSSSSSVSDCVTMSNLLGHSLNYLSMSEFAPSLDLTLSTRIGFSD